MAEWELEIVLGGELLRVAEAWRDDEDAEEDSRFY